MFQADQETTVRHVWSSRGETELRFQEHVTNCEQVMSLFEKHINLTGFLAIFFLLKMFVLSNDLSLGQANNEKKGNFLRGILSMFVF